MPILNSSQRKPLHIYKNAVNWFGDNDDDLWDPDKEFGLP